MPRSRRLAEPAAPDPARGLCSVVTDQPPSVPTGWRPREWSAKADIGGAYVQVTIHILIKLDLGDAGKRFTEENDEVKRERAQAGKPIRFRELPLELMLIHEEIHAQDVCQALSAIAASRIRCGMTEQDKDQLRSDMRAAYEAILARADHGADADDPGGVDGELERDIRRRTWDEWERRHPPK